MHRDLRPTRRSALALTGLGLGAALLAACGESSAEDSGGLSVITSAYPLTYLIQRIGGDLVSLTDLATPGADAHGLELSVKQTMAVQEAALVVQIPGFQAALDDAISSSGGENALDVSTVIDLLPVGDDAHHDEEGDEESHEGHDHGPTDPHFWHDPTLMATLGDAIAERLAALSPENAETFTSAAETLRAELVELDAELAEKYGAAPGERPFITSHTAYSYLARRYDLHQIGISGVDPEAEPSPQRLLALEEVVKEEGVTTIFFESTASPKVAQTLADNLGITSEELHNLETQESDGSDYPAVMRENCTALVASWQ